MRRIFVLLALVFITFSCIRDVDYNQVNSTVLSTPISLALLKLDLNQTDFLDSHNNEITFIYESYLVDLSGLFYENSTDSLVHATTFTSTFNRDIYCQFVYFDETNTQLFSSQRFLVTSSNSPITYSTTYQGANYDLFIRARRIDTRISLQDGTPIQQDDNQSFSLQSVIHFIFELQP